jgi:hypothetical protein
VLTAPQLKLLEELVQPAGSFVKSEVTNSAPAGAPSFVVNVMATGWPPVFCTAVICDAGDGVAITVLAFAAKYGMLSAPLFAAPESSW